MPRTSSSPHRLAGIPLTTLPAPPPTLPPWERVVWYLVETIALGGGYSAFKYGAQILGFGGSDPNTTPHTWRRFSFKWENQVSLEASDDVYFTLDIANITSGNLDSTWTSADYDTVYPRLANIAGGISVFTASHLHLTAIAAYVMGFNDYANPKPFAQSGPPEHTYAMNTPGALAQPAGAQICTTCTEMTPIRTHWGRFYSPSLGANALVGGGRLASQYVNSLANAVHDNYQLLMQDQFFPVVPTTQSNKQPLRALQAVTGVRVDDVPDVQRSRRPKYANLKVTLPLVTHATLPAPEAA